MACSNPALFKERFRAKGTSPAGLLRSIGVGPKKAIVVELGWLGELLEFLMANSFQVVTVGVEDEGGIIGRGIIRSNPRLPIVASARA